MLRMKPGAVLGTPAPAGFRLLAAIDRASRLVRVDLTLTCGTDSHGPDDPHTRGEAYDVRTRDLTASQAQRVLRAVLTDLSADQRKIPGFNEMVIAATAFGRYGETGDIAGAILLLLQPEAGWITAQIIEVSGGLRI